MDIEAKIRALHRAVAIEATRGGHGSYLGGLSEKAEHHAANIVPALCRVLQITEDDLVAMREAHQPRDETAN